jgi:hypothetical protein
MHVLIKAIPVILYFLVGIISLVMAQKSLFSKGFLPFHEAAVGTSLGKLDQRVQNVILALMRTTGLGFLSVGSLLVVFPVVNYLKPDPVIRLGIPFVCEVYCLGLFLTNYRLHKKSGVETPWKGSLIAVVVIAIGMIISYL